MGLLLNVTDGAEGARSPSFTAESRRNLMVASDRLIDLAHDRDRDEMVLSVNGHTIRAARYRACWHIDIAPLPETNPILALSFHCHRWENEKRLRIPSSCAANAGWAAAILNSLVQQYLSTSTHPWA